MRTYFSITQEISDSPQEKLVCCYRNETALPEIVSICNTVEYCFERTVFPGQIIRFEARFDAVLEVRSCSTVTASISDRIPCVRLTCAVPLYQKEDGHQVSTLQQIFSIPPSVKPL